MRVVLCLLVALAVGCSEERPKPKPKRRDAWRKKTVKVVKEKAGLESAVSTVEESKKIVARSYRPGARISFISGRDCFYSGATKTRVDFTKVITDNHSRMDYGESRRYTSAASKTSIPIYYSTRDTSQPFMMNGFVAQVRKGVLYIKPPEDGDWGLNFDITRGSD